MFTNEVSKATTTPAAPTVKALKEAPVITENPADKALLVGEDAAFEAAASGVPTPTVQWQVSTDGGVAWSDLPGASTDTLSVQHTTTSESGYEYRAVFVSGGCVLGRVLAGGWGFSGSWARSVLLRVKGRVTRTRVGQPSLGN